MQSVTPCIDMTPYSQQAASSLYECLVDMGARKTNPVLEVLQGVDKVKAEQKYPEDYLRFGDDADWRVFYHCHTTPDINTQEHGHFHIFARVPDTNDWTHVAGLAMDSVGQPLHWFAVNQWVTNEHWLPMQQVADMLKLLPRSGDMALEERWLVAMLDLFQTDIQELLILRDEKLNALTLDREPEQVFADRDLYTLGVIPIDIKYTLESALVG